MLRRMAEGTRWWVNSHEPFEMLFAAAAKHAKSAGAGGAAQPHHRGLLTSAAGIEAGPLAGAADRRPASPAFWTFRLDDLERALTRNAWQEEEKEMEAIPP